MLSSWSVSRKGNGGLGDRILGPSPINARGIVYTRDTTRQYSFSSSTSSTCSSNGSTPLYAGRAVAPTPNGATVCTSNPSSQGHLRFSRTQSHPHPSSEHFSASSPLPPSGAPTPVRKTGLHSASFPLATGSPSKDLPQIPVSVRSRSAELSYGAVPYKNQNARPGPSGNWPDHLGPNGRPRMILLPLSSVPVATTEEMAVTDTLVRAVVRYVRAVWDRSDQYTADFLFTYVIKLVEHLECDVFVILSGIEYLRRLRERFPEAGHSSDAKRLLTMGLMTAAKFHRDRPYNNKAWASVSKMAPATLNTMEEQFLHAIDYRVNVTEGDLAQALTEVQKVYGQSVNLNLSEVKGEDFWTPLQAVVKTSAEPVVAPATHVQVQSGEKSAVAEAGGKTARNFASPPRTSCVVGEHAAAVYRLENSKRASDRYTPNSAAVRARESHVFCETDTANDSSSSPSPNYSWQESGFEEEHRIVVALSETRLAQATWKVSTVLSGKKNKPPPLVLAGAGGFEIASSKKVTVAQKV